MVHGVKSKEKGLHNSKGKCHSPIFSPFQCSIYYVRVLNIGLYGGPGGRARKHIHHALLQVCTEHESKFAPRTNRSLHRALRTIHGILFHNGIHFEDYVI